MNPINVRDIPTDLRFTISREWLNTDLRELDKIQDFCEKLRKDD